MRNVAANLGLALASIVLLFAAMEIGLRIMGRSPTNPPPPLYARSDDPSLSYTLRPNVRIKAFRSTITTNSLGFRGLSPGGQDLLGGKRVEEVLTPLGGLLPILGDSLVFGYGVEGHETLPARIQEKLPAFSVLNAGVPGYTLKQERFLYEERITPLNPVALVLVFYWNDLYDGVAVLDDAGSLHTEGWVPGTSACSQPDVGPFSWNPLHCALMKKSAFYYSYYKLANSLYGRRTLKEERETSQENPTETIADNDLSRYEQELTAFVETLPKDFPRLFVIWPERFLHPVATPKLRRIAERHGFTVLDLTEHFGNEVPVLSWDTVHPSPAALTEAADIIVEQLHTMGL